jgi:hypothetical protein
MTDLLTLQRRFHRALGDDSDTLNDIVPGAARRLAIHRTTIEAGLGQTLTNVFPVVRRVVGPPTFALLISDFIADTPPRQPVLSGYGRGFPAFIAMQPIAASLPYLQDLARVEWARQESYLAADAPILDAGRLDTENAEALSALMLRLHPAARVISSPFPVHRIWRLNQPDVDEKDIPAVDMTVDEHVIVTRPGSEVVTRATSLADATLVRAVAGGESLGAAVDAAFARAPDFDVTQALAGHFANGTFTN